MEHCVGCGHALGQSLYCAQCGRPCDRDDWRTGTAERPVVPPIAEPGPLRPPGPPPASAPPPPPQPAVRRPSLPPPVVAAPPAARYPLYADEAVGLVGSAPAVASAGEPAPTLVGPSPAPAPGTATYAASPASPAPAAGASGRRVLPWVVGVVVVLLAALVGTLLLLGPGDAGDRGEDPAAATSSPSATSEPSPAEAAKAEEPATDEEPADPPRRRRPAQVTRSLTVEVPETAQPNQDVRGNLVRYEATNLIDGVPTTCWRMPGSGAGEEIVLTLAEPTRVAQVGLINGYAKTSGDLDWYTGNRRVLAVEWVFDDGTTVAQSLVETRAMQTQAIKPVRTRAIRLRLVEVSAPGGGRAARNYTAISDVSVTGTPL